MGLDSFTSDDEESSSTGQSTYVTFNNPRATDISEGSEHRHKQKYYDAVQALRNKLGQDINVLAGELFHAANEADEGNTEPLNELFSELAEEGGE